MEGEVFLPTQEFPFSSICELLATCEHVALMGPSKSSNALFLKCLPLVAWQWLTAASSREEQPHNYLLF